MVSEVIHDSGQPFAIVRAVPTAMLNRSRYMLLVFTDPRTPEQRATESAQAQEALDQEILQQAQPAVQAAGASEPAVNPPEAAQ
jgi:rod shape-determining protein MreC